MNRQENIKLAGDAGRNALRHRRVLSWIGIVLSMATAALLTLTLPGCRTNPATGEEHISLVSESQEIEMGRQADQEIVATMGLYPDSGLQRYIQDLGMQMARRSERPDLPWTFRVVDDPVVNAFALPGGFIYVTRGLMTHVENEAELAGVVGHEIGHVTAQHSVNRMSSAQLAQLGLIAGMIIEPGLQRYQNAIGAGLSLLFLKFSRDDEKQADDLGLRYMTRVNYDPREMIEVFEMLSRVSQASGGGRLPEWLATHPNPENRQERIAKAVDTMNLATTGAEVNKESYLRLIDGMTFGDNPREGYFKDGVFYQPDLMFQFRFPSNWQAINQKQAVVGVSKNQDAIIQVSMARGNSSEAAANNFFSQQGLQAGQPRSGSVNGHQTITGEFRAATEQGQLHGQAAFIGYGGNVYQIVGYTTEQQWGRYRNQIVQAIQSFDDVTDLDKLDVEPQRIRVVAVQSPATLGQIANEYNASVDIETLALINQTTSNETFNQGDLVKVVVDGEGTSTVDR